MAVLILRQSLESSADNIKNTFSSWDSCMSKAYCKSVALSLLHDKTRR